MARGAHDRCDVIKYANKVKIKRTQLDYWATHLGKFGCNRPRSFGKRLSTGTQTHTQTHTQTERQTDNPGFPDPDYHNTFSQRK